MLKVALPAPLAPQARLQLEMRFSDPIPAGKDVGNYGEFALKDNILALAGFYPTMVVYGDQGWHLERPSLQGDVLYADASLYDVSLTAPAALTVVATGETRERKDNGDGSATWRLTGGPMRDFNIAASADYLKVSRQVGAVVVNSYAVKQDAEGGRDALDWASAALNTYQTAFGLYPYRELDVVETPTSAGGIEYPGMVVIAARLYSDPQRRLNFEGATAHEVAHQYWYNVVGDDQLNTPWLDESLAQYSTGLYYGSQYGEARARLPGTGLPGTLGSCQQRTEADWFAGCRLQRRRIQWHCVWQRTPVSSRPGESDRQRQNGRPSAALLSGICVADRDPGRISGTGRGSL